MSRKPKQEKTVIYVPHDGGVVRVSLFPPDEKRKSWYAYWTGQKTSRSTGRRTLVEATKAATAMVQGLTNTSSADDDVLTDEELKAIQRTHFEKRTDPVAKKRAESSLGNALEALDAFKLISGLEKIASATPDDCERFQVEAMKKPRNWRSKHPRSKPESRTISPATVRKWLVALQAAFERANVNGGKKCVRGVVSPTRLLKSNPWRQFTWISGPAKKIEQFKGDDLLGFLKYLREKWTEVTAAEAMLKLFVWSWARREEVAGLKWEDLRIVDDEVHFDCVGKWDVEKWFRIPRPVYEDLLSFRTDSPYVFAALMDQVRQRHIAAGRAGTAKSVKDFTVYNAGQWFYQRIHDWSGGSANVHMFRKTALQYARAGEDAARSMARDARVSTSVMLTHYVKEEDPQLRAASNSMFERLCLSMNPEVAQAFGFTQSPTVALEGRLRMAIGSRNWALVGQVAMKLAEADRQAG